MYTRIFLNELLVLVQLLILKSINFSNHFEPSPDYKLPRGAMKKISFQCKWLLQCKPLLVYSELANGGYYLPCVLFATSSSSYHWCDPGILVSRPLNNFGKALQLFGKHQCKEYHLLAITKLDIFLGVMEGQQPSISSQINQGISKTITNNSLTLRSIVETIIFCG